MAMDEYTRARKLGLKEVAEMSAAGKNPYPVVLDDIIAERGSAGMLALGIMEIPLSLIGGTKTSGRQNVFSASFLPIAEPGSEFAAKWESLYASQVAEGIREPIIAYEYQHRFYVQEGNKRVSVARYLGSATVATQVTRVLPKPASDERSQAYQEFLAFYKVCPLYGLDFDRPGSYERLARLLGYSLDEPWPEEVVRRLKSTLAVFVGIRESSGQNYGVALSDAFLAYVQAYRDNGPLDVGKDELKRRMHRIHDELVVAAEGGPVSFANEAPRPKGVVSSIRGATKKVVGDRVADLAFIYDVDPKVSGWTAQHDKARTAAEAESMGKIRTMAFTGCHDDAAFDQAVDEALKRGSDLIVTVSPRQFEQTMRASTHHPKAHFVNCSVNLASSHVRTFYARMYEVKFLMGALAASLADNHRLGYLAVSPIYGSVCEVNAFALGAAMIDPYATVHLEWLSVEDRNWDEVFREADASVVAGADYPDPENDRTPYGLYRRKQDGTSERVALPVWDWKRYYELIAESLRDGSWQRETKTTRKQARNYWLGMRSGVVRLETQEGLAESQRRLLEILTQALLESRLDPFGGTLSDQTGSVVRRAEDEPLTDREIATMRWLAPNVVGRLPKASELTQGGLKAVEASGIIASSSVVKGE